MKESNSTKLLPCPFCGEGAEIVVCDEEGNLRDAEYEKEPWSGLSYRVFHPSETCPVGHLEPDEPKWLYDTEAEAVKAWNTRHERTCRMKPSENGVGLKQWGCSGCGGMTVSDLEPPFCSKCGARVKEETDA